MWVALDTANHVWQRNLAETVADYLNTHRIDPDSVIVLNVTEKTFEGIGWQDELIDEDDPRASEAT